ncbi:MAG: SEC-C metal-binding domain-containing protein, partial [Woeseia sp.]
EESAPRKKKDRETTFEEFAGAARELFADSLASYANLGRSVFDAVAERSTRQQEPARSAKVGRNAQCPCGSGRKYKKCCGGHLH